MNTALHVTVKPIYGIDKLYPVNTPAELLARIAGTKTLTLQTLETALELGFELVVCHRHGAVITRYPGGHVEAARAAVADLLALYNIA